MSCTTKKSARQLAGSRSEDPNCRSALPLRLARRDCERNLWHARKTWRRHRTAMNHMMGMNTQDCTGLCLCRSASGWLTKADRSVGMVRHQPSGMAWRVLFCNPWPRGTTLHRPVALLGGVPVAVCYESWCHISERLLCFFIRIRKTIANARCGAHAVPKGLV
jgi:hypothetical protein